MEIEKIGSFINGQFIYHEETAHPIHSPYDDQQIASVSYALPQDVSEAIAKAKQAQRQWAALTYKKRTEVIFRLRTLLEEQKEDLAETICRENGKSKAEGLAGVSKAIELCEFAVSIPALIAGKTEVVSTGIEVREQISPVGIVASVTPFNFPMMVPMWTIPNTLVCGNAMILKPSEATPITAARIARLLQAAGLPDGLFAVVNGSRDVVEQLCDHPDIHVLTFVGSTPAAESVYRRATSHLKRCLALGGAKNHILVTEETDPKTTASEICSAAYGMSGQRCMAASVVLAIGHCETLIEEIIRLSRNMVCGRDLPPLISRAAVAKVEGYLDQTLGHVVVDGRQAAVEGDPHGYYIGPSVILYDDSDQIDDHEVFGPTLEILRVKTLEEAIAIQNCSPYGNGASIFTDTGLYAMQASEGLSSGMLGINIGVPVPRDPFSFGGLKASKFGYGDITGYGALPLLTVTRKITTKWNPKHRKDWMS